MLLSVVYKSLPRPTKALVCNLFLFFLVAEYLNQVIDVVAIEDVIAEGK